MAICRGLRPCAFNSRIRSRSLILFGRPSFLPLARAFRSPAATCSRTLVFCHLQRGSGEKNINFCSQFVGHFLLCWRFVLLARLSWLSSCFGEFLLPSPHSEGATTRKRGQKRRNTSVQFETSGRLSDTGALWREACQWRPSACESTRAGRRQIGAVTELSKTNAGRDLKHRKRIYGPKREVPRCLKRFVERN